MIDIKTATKKASDYLISFYPNAKEAQIEEIEVESKKNEWLITLSFILYDDNPFSVATPPRKYKIFVIDTSTGEIKAMKIREFK